MIPQADILDDYIQMREGNLLRESADINLIKTLKEELAKEHSARLKAEEKVKDLEREIQVMRSAQPITNNINIGRDYIDKQVVGL